MKRSPLRRSAGTRVPPEMTVALLERDRGCVGPRVGLPGRCEGPLDPDHVRASGALGKKSRTTMDNLVILCRYAHHRYKTEHGREVRPILLDYLARFLPADPLQLEETGR